MLLPHVLGNPDYCVRGFADTTIDHSYLPPGPDVGASCRLELYLSDAVVSTRVTSCFDWQECDYVNGACPASGFVDWHFGCLCSVLLDVVSFYFYGFGGE